MRRAVLRWLRKPYKDYITAEGIIDGQLYDENGNIHPTPEIKWPHKFWSGNPKESKTDKLMTSGIYICRHHPIKYGLEFTSKRKCSTISKKTIHFYKIIDAKKFFIFAIKYPELIYFNPMSK
jgi:hypothetical protein